MSCFVNCCFLKITGMLLIKVHRTFDSQTAILHSHLKDIFVFLFQRILLSPRFTSCYYAFPFQGYNIFISFPKNSIIPLSHYSIYIKWILKIGACVCVGHSLLWTKNMEVRASCPLEPYLQTFSFPTNNILGLHTSVNVYRCHKE